MKKQILVFMIVFACNTASASETPLSTVIISEDLSDGIAETIKQTTEKCKGEIDRAFHSYLEGYPANRTEFDRDLAAYVNGHAIFKMDRHLKKMNDMCLQLGLRVENIDIIKKDILSDLDRYYGDMVKDDLKKAVSDDVFWSNNIWPIGEKRLKRGCHWASDFCNYGFWEGVPHGKRNLNSSIRCDNQWREMLRFMKNTMDHKSVELENSSAYSDEQRKALSDTWKELAKRYR